MNNEITWQMFDGPYSLPRFLESLGIEPHYAEAIIYNWIPHLEEWGYDDTNDIKYDSKEEAYRSGYDDAIAEVEFAISNIKY